jgi:hypothetical protein
MVFHLQLGGLDAAVDPETTITYEKSFAFLFGSVKLISFPGCKSFGSGRGGLVPPLPCLDSDAMMIASEKTFASYPRLQSP